MPPERRHQQPQPDPTVEVYEPPATTTDLAWIPEPAPEPGTRRRPPRRRPTTSPLPGEDPDIPTGQRLTRRLLGDVIDLDLNARAKLYGWLGPLLIALLGGFVRFWQLGRPHQLVFDETYYVKDSYSLLVRGYEASWASDPNVAFEAGIVDGLGYDPSYVAHPLVGKWLIALGIQLGGGIVSSSSWRLTVAVIGTLAILVVARLARRMFASTALGMVAGLLMAVDGLAIVMSRTTLLDPILMFFVLLAFGALLLDRDQSRRRLASRVARIIDGGGTLHRWGPSLGFRWWRLLAGVLLGLAIGTKWSGIYFLAVFGLLTVIWDMAARRQAGVRSWFVGAIVRDGLIAFAAMVVTALVTYVASWTSWFLSDSAWDRHWAEDHPGLGATWLPDPLTSLWHYHQTLWEFHNNLESPHSYAAHPIGWIVQWRPTSFYYPTEVSGLTGDDAVAACGLNNCSQAVTSLGNPLLWWLGAAAIVVALFWLITRRDWRAGAVLSGILAGWVPWLFYAHRTIFTFYSIAFLPWMVLTLTYALGLLIGTRETTTPDERKTAIIAVGVLLVLIVAVSAFFYPVWTAQVIPYNQWRWRMWLPSWI